MFPFFSLLFFLCFSFCLLLFLAHQNRTIAIASDFRVDGTKSPEIPQKEGVLGSEIAARTRKSLATFHRTLKSQCNIAFSCLGNRAISGGRDGHRNRKSQKSLRFRCAKLLFVLPRIAIARFPYRGPEPRNPKSAFWSLKMPFWTPRKNGPNSQFPKTGLLDILIDFRGHFSGGSKAAFFRL